MRMRRWSLLLGCWGGVACGFGGPSASLPPPATVDGAGAGSTGGLDAALAARALALLEPCARVVRSMDAWTPSAETPPLPLGELARGCRDFDTLYEEAAPEGIQRSRTTLRVLGGLARLHEDVRILGVQLRAGDGPPLASAVEHLRGSTREEEAAFRAALTATDGPALGAPPPPLSDAQSVRQEVVRRLQNASQEATILETGFENYARGQGEDSTMYRRLMLRHFRAAIRVLWDVDRRHIEAHLHLLDATSRRSWEAYAAAMEGYVSAGERAIQVYLDGAVERATADRLHDEMTAAARRWDDARGDTLRVMGSEPR